METISPIIEAKDLATIIDRTDVILVDARAGKEARQQYIKGHLPGAIFIDLETQLAEHTDDASKGGRHPLPQPSVFTAELGRIGIGRDSHVIIYDDKSGSNAAARFWWMLRAVGHERVQVLNGGLQAAVREGLDVVEGEPVPREARTYPTVEEWQLPLADLQVVKAASESGDGMIVDVRDSERYKGNTEPIDPVAGHIPGAVNIPFVDNLDGEGKFREPSDLRNKYLEALSQPAEKVMIHCGSGVTACHSILAMDYAGLPLPKLYIGSWGEWCRNELPVARS